MIAPYWQDDELGVTLYHGDAEEVLPHLADSGVDVIITDPVWPNAIPELAGYDDPYGLFARVAQHFPAVSDRLVVQLGCDSDPRFLTGVPDDLKFVRTCWLKYAMPGYKGRILYSGDVAYVFGKLPPVKKGARLMPGEVVNTTVKDRSYGHPTQRRLQHVEWLVKWFARGLIMDPFVGSGTTMEAAVRAGYPAIGIDVRTECLDMTIERLERTRDEVQRMRQEADGGE